MIREPAVAGQFYSANPSSLRKTVDSFLVPPDEVLDAKGVLAPHAGYIYSGAVAGAVYAAVRIPHRVVVLGPNHTARGEPVALHPPGRWRTPLGLVPIDEELNEIIERECPSVRQDRASHAQEHSLEVQLPFLQARTHELKFAALCIGTSDYRTLEDLGRALARALNSLGEPVLLVASSDMSHYEAAETAARKDRAAIDQVVRLDPAGLYRTVMEKHISMCGFAPTIAMLVACLGLGASEGRLIRYANSGDVSGDHDRVVGYASMAIV